MDRSSVPPSLSAALLDALLHQPGVGVAVYDRALRYVHVNDTLAAAHGLAAEDHVGRTTAEVAPTIAPHTLAIMQRVLETGEPAIDVDVVEVIEPDRRREWIASFHPLRAPCGAIDGVVALARDRTAAKAADRKLHLLLEASRFLATSLDPEASAETVARVLVPAFADGCIVDVADPGETPRPLAVVHVDPEKQALLREIRARFPVDLESPDGASNAMRTGISILHRQLDDAVHDNAGLEPERLQLVKKVAPRSSMTAPLMARGRTFGAITVLSTRDERRFDEADLALLEELAARAALAIDNARLYRDAQEANRTKDEFLGTVSHELRTPLTAILGWAHILEKKRDPESIERGLAIIERNAKSQAQIIEDILDVSRIISGKLRLDLRAVELAPAVQAAIDVVRPSAEARGIELAARLEEGLGQVLGDADRLQQVAWNLLSNAIKFTPKGGRVELHMTRVGSAARMVVRDTGKGIDPEFLPHVFERFRQADSSTSRAHAGLGLGLSIVRHIVELHGGYVRAESAGKGKGATFVVDVPLHAPTRVAEARASTPSPSPNGRRLDGLKVLVVDDEPDARDLIAVILGDQGAEVTTAASASEAFKQIVSVRPDVLVSDIGMPGEDGYWLIRKVRALKDDLARVPAIALTAYARADDARKAFLAGYQMHVAKPVEPATLTAVVFDVGGRNHEA
jgi:PAS domain S-box-containing protein